MTRYKRLWCYFAGHDTVTCSLWSSCWSYCARCGRMWDAVPTPDMEFESNVKEEEHDAGLL